MLLLDVTNCVIENTSAVCDIYAADLFEYDKVIHQKARPGKVHICMKIEVVGEARTFSEPMT